VLVERETLKQREPGEEEARATRDVGKIKVKKKSSSKGKKSARQRRLSLLGRTSSDKLGRIELGDGIVKSRKSSKSGGGQEKRKEVKGKDLFSKKNCTTAPPAALGANGQTTNRDVETGSRPTRQSTGGFPLYPYNSSGRGGGSLENRLGAGKKSRGATNDAERGEVGENGITSGIISLQARMTEKENTGKFWKRF